MLVGLAYTAAVSIVLSYLDYLGFTWTELVFSLVVLVATSFAAHLVLASSFSKRASLDSSLITGLILYFVLAPIKDGQDVITAIFAALLAVASKFLLVSKKRHIFNPAAFSLVLLGLLGIGSGTWWVANVYLLPFIVLLGLMVGHKMRRFPMILTFIVASVVSILFFNFRLADSVFELMLEALTSWPIIFFAFVMLTDPKTSPRFKNLQVMYAGIVGLLFGVPFHVGPIFPTPEMLLLVGNVFTFFTFGLRPKRA